jgi:hypothetical protein
VLALAPDLAPLGPGEGFALDLLLDLSRVLRIERDVVDAGRGGEAGAIRLHVMDAPASDDLAPLRARGWGISVADGRVTIERALLRAVHQLAGAVREQRSAAVDRFGRVPSAENALVRAGLEREPLVSTMARALADAVVRAAGRRPALFLAPWPTGRRWAAALTHDLDVVQWWPAFTALRLAELARKGRLGQMLHVVGAATRSGGREVVWRGVRDVLAAEERHDVRSTWFILCGTPTFATMRAGDLTYRPESALARRILAALREGGHEVELHGSFATSEDHGQFAAQRARLAALAGTEVNGVRQHYLRMRPGSTHRRMSEAGFAFDSTYGFADRNGFRLGVADVVPVWDEAAGASLPIDEAPFTWMDRALSKYAGVERPDAWIDDALDLADRVRAVDGLWVGIWHPNLTPALGYPGAPNAYARLLAGLAEREAYIAPLGDIVAWRQARRAARATALLPSGAVSLAASSGAPGGQRIAVESATGHSVDVHVDR